MKAVLTVMAAALLAACATPGPGVTPPAAAELPATQVVPAVAADWWTAFNDNRLNTLVDEALRHNRDLQRAVARVDESRAALRLAGAERGPIVAAGLDAQRARASETTAMPGGGIGNDFRATLSVAYEVDFWGRIRRASDAAREELFASDFARATVHNAVAAQVVQGYATLRALDEQRDVFRRAVDAQREALGLQRKRFEAGDMSELDWRQLEAELFANESQLPRLDRAIGETERALALLLGRSPRAIVEQGITRASLDAAPLVGGGVPPGLPSDLLARRPDVQQAEARLRAAGARVDVARAAYLPRITLTAGLGQQSAELSDLFNGPSTIFSVLASLTQPIWNAGALDARRDVALAQARQAELDYRDAVATAFKEVRDAIGAQAEAQTTLTLTERRAQALARASELTTVRLQGGVSSRLDAIEAERAALNARAQLADARRAVAASQVDVFRALGGGWAQRQ